jgi:hypothetical protein
VAVFSFARRRTKTHLTATVRGAVAGRQLDGGHTLIKSSPVARTISSVHNGFDRYGHSIFWLAGLRRRNPMLANSMDEVA